MTKRSNTIETIIICGYILVFLVFGILMAKHTTTFNAPDERMHYYVIKFIAHEYRLPELSTNKVTNEAHQPPLYYLFNLPLFYSTRGIDLDTRVFILRIFSLGLSAFVIPIVWWVTKKLFEDNVWLRLTIMAFVALNPQFIFMSSVINNDALANVLGAMLCGAIAVACLHHNFTKRQLISFLILAILAFLTKVNLWPLIAVLYSVLLITAKQKNNLIKVSLLLSPIVLVAAWWFWHNWQVYHSLTGLNRMQELWYAEQHRDFLSVQGLYDWCTTLFNTYWARFGYFNIALPGIFYRLFQGLFFAGCIGWVVFFIKNYSRFKHKFFNQAMYITLAWFVGSSLVMLQLFLFNLNFYQAQGRYLFVIMLPIVSGLAFGLMQFFPKRWHWIVPVIVTTLLLFADIASIRVISQYVAA